MKTLQQLATATGINENKLTSIYYETGCNYIDELSQRIKDGKIFEIQFGRFIRTGMFHKMSIQSVFAVIQKSPIFWAWWLTNVAWMVEHSDKCNANSLCAWLENCPLLIPETVINQIFNNNECKPKRQEKPRSGAHKAKQPAHESLHA